MEVMLNRAKGESLPKRGNLGSAPRFPSGGEIGQAVGIAVGEIVGFAKVYGEVVELPRAGLVADGLARSF